jgi:hypothetical protein
MVGGVEAHWGTTNQAGESSTRAKVEGTIRRCGSVICGNSESFSSFWNQLDSGGIAYVDTENYLSITRISAADSQNHRFFLALIE